MNTKEIYLSKSDYHLLTHLTRDPSVSSIQNGWTASLKGELQRAIVVDDSALSANRVGLNCRVTVRDLETGEREEYRLRMPADMDNGENSISVLSPIGTILLGYAAGDEISCDTPGGSRRILIESVRRITSLPRAKPSVIDEILNGSL